MPRNQRLYPTDFPEMQIPSEAVTAGLGIEDIDMPTIPGAETLGAFTETSPEYQQILGEEPEVSDEQAQRWMEEREVYDAKIQLDMLTEKILNSRRDLIDKLYGGDDPSLRNTKPIIDELRKMEMKTFTESIGDPEEMTPQQKLQVAIQKVNISRTVGARVESDKQKDMQILNDAVSQYNEGIKAQMTSVQQQAEAIQELHTAQDEAMAEAGKPKKVSNFRWAYDIWKKDNPKGTPTEFRRKEWERPSGGLTEASIVKSIDDLALTEEGIDPATAYSNYLKYRKTLGREEAFNKVRQEMMRETKTIKGITFEKREDGKWYPQQ